jgi:hypothetical protein
MSKLIGFKPYPKQREVIDNIINSDAMFHIMVNGRQSGKSTTLLGLILYYSINKPKSVTLYTAPTYGQINKILVQLIDVLQPTGIVVSANKASYEVKLINGSMIYFRSTERADSIRGLAVDYLLGDESQDTHTTDFQKSILPTITARGKKCILAGTPKRKGFFYDYFQMGKSEDFPNHVSYHFPSWESPYVSKEFIEEQRRTLPPNIFSQEFEAKWQDNEGSVFQNLSGVCVNDLWPARDRNLRVYGGLDIGSKDDYTVLVILDELGRCLNVWRANHISYSEIVRKVVDTCKHYNVNELLCEVNGVGDPIYEQIKKEYSRATPFFQTNQSKENTIRRLMGDIQDQALELPSYNLMPEFTQELEIYEYEILASGKIRYTHPNGMHDDIVDALAMANWSRINSKKGSGIKIGSIR